MINPQHTHHCLLPHLLYGLLHQPLLEGYVPQFTTLPWYYQLASLLQRGWPSWSYLASATLFCRIVIFHSSLELTRVSAIQELYPQWEWLPITLLSATLSTTFETSVVLGQGSLHFLTSLPIQLLSRHYSILSVSSHTTAPPPSSWMTHTVTSTQVGCVLDSSWPFWTNSPFSLPIQTTFLY